MQCKAAAAHLGLGELPEGILVHERVRQLAEYLGAGQFFYQH